MTAQTFRAPHMMAALAEVQRQLGPDALIVSVRQVAESPAWQVWKKPAIEVVAMPPPAQAQARPGPTESRTAGKRPAASRRGEVQALAAGLVSRFEPTPRGRRDLGAYAALPPTLARLQQRLLAQGVDEELVERMTTVAVESLSPRAFRDEASVRRQLGQQMEAYIRVRSSPASASERVICLVGASGSGKTSVTAMLAARYARAHEGGGVVWVCADTTRVGATAQARAWTESLGLPLRLAYSPPELAEAVAAESQAGLILVDMPGCNPHEEASVVEVVELLTALPERGTYLVAPATAREADLSQALAAFSPFGLRGLIVTKLDETGALGDIYNLAWRSQLPLAYLVGGRRVLEDLQPASAARLVSALLGE